MVKTSTEAVRRFRARNKEKVREQTRIQSREWARAHPEAQRKWKENNLEKYREIGRSYHLRKNGWTIEDFNKVLSEQNKQCWICSIELTIIKGSGNTAHADHNHKTGKRRGILCAKCNFIEGLLSKSVISPSVLITKLAEYYKVFDIEEENVLPMVRD